MRAFGPPHHNAAVAHIASLVVTIRSALTFLLIAVGLIGRSALDKVLTVQGGAERVALWGQISSIFDIVTGVASAGVGAGLVVYVTRSQRKAAQREHLSEACGIGLRLALPVALVLSAGSWLLNDVLSGARISPWFFAVAAAAGWIGVIPMLISNYWLAQRHYGPMLMMAIAQSGLMLVAALAFPARSALAWVAVVQALPAAVLPFLSTAKSERGRFYRRRHPLRRYILPGLSIGIFSPLSMLLVRSAVAEALSWHDAGVLQALFRMADWVCAIAGGFLSLVHLPRFAAARSVPAFALELKSAAKATLLPCAAAFAVLFVLHRPLLEALYDPSVQASDLAVALFFTGSLVRIGAWILLFALYARRRTREIAIGELLSLPLFVVLVFGAGRLLTLELAGALWLVAYCAYGAYNLRAVRQSRNAR